MRLNEYAGLLGRYSWNRGIPCILFKIIIQLYLLRSFLYSVTYCIKEVTNGKTFWIWNEKSVGLWGSYGLKQGNTLQFFSKHWSNCICFVYLSIFDLLYQRGYQRPYFWALNLKVLAYEAASACNRGIHSKILTFLIRSYLFCLLINCST